MVVASELLWLAEVPGAGRVDRNTDGPLPAPLNGRSLYAGFGRWSAEMFEGNSLEAAHVLQMGILVSFSGMLDFMAMGARHRNSAVVMETIKGACYATQPERIEGAVFCHDKRDFTDADDTMLQFLK